tara:strand:+ start:2221 stop:4332 length:2112 start_codon:yes stop_codon:yes gene_type:complete
MDRKNELLLRVYLVLICFIVFAGLISWKLIDISIVEGDKWKAEKTNKYLKWRPIEAQRGDIYSDDGIRMLASSIEFFEIRMDPVSPSDEDFDAHIYGLCIGLERTLATKSANEWRSIIEGARKSYKNATSNSQKKGTRNVLIAKKIDDGKYREIKALPLFNLGKYKGGMKVERFFSRKKTYHELASRTIGLYRDQNMVGIERSYDKALRGAERSELMRFVPPDLWIPLEEPTEYQIIRGKDVVTTIDVDIQDVVHNELKIGMVKNDAKDGVVIIMDVKTGYIKALSNLKLHNGEVNEVMNKAVVERIEPGSTFKAATALALLEKGISPGQDVRIDKGKKKFYDRWMFDSNYPSDVIISDFSESFSKSSNVGIATLANDNFNSKAGKKEFFSYLKQFGLVDKTGIDLLGEPEPFIKNPDKGTTAWSGVTAPWMAHGYELQITPLQMLAFYNAVANNGIYMKPRLVKNIKENHEVLKHYNPKTKKERIASLESIVELKKMMEDVVTKGTGANIYTDEYGIAGKTGTAAFDYLDKENKGYNASFAGYFPADNPRYSMIVVAYGLKGNKYYGSQVAAPIFRRIADKVMILEGGLTQEYSITDSKTLPRSSKGFGGDFEAIYSEISQTEGNYPRWARIESEGARTIAQKALIRKKEVPDVYGMGLRDAVYVLENIGMRVKVHGAGKVYKQSMRPGARLDKENIEIYLN